MTERPAYRLGETLARCGGFTVVLPANTRRHTVVLRREPDRSSRTR